MPQIIASQQPYSGHVVAVRVDRIRLEDGHECVQEVVEHRPSMTVIALDRSPGGEEEIILVRQYRHPTGQVILETPAGSVDEGESVEEAVNRELAEETGLQARVIQPLGAFYLAPGWCNEYMHAYLARDLYEAPLPPDADERIEVVRMPVSEWETLVRNGSIQDCKSIAAWHLAQPHL